MVKIILKPGEDLEFLENEEGSTKLYRFNGYSNYSQKNKTIIIRKVTREGKLI